MQHVAVRPAVRRLVRQFSTFPREMMSKPFTFTRGAVLSAVLSTLVLLAGCVSNQSKPEAPPAAEQSTPPAAEAVNTSRAADKPECQSVASKKKSRKSAKGKAAASEECVPAAAPARRAAAKNTGGYDLSKNSAVTDSTKVESGQGTQVTGINDWQGEITGLPAANSRFTRLKIGMPQQQVIDLIGQPTDQGAYVTGKAFIPFYFGSDKSRWEMVYKGQGRLIFSNQSGFGTGYYLTWIIHNASEGGYR